MREPIVSKGQMYSKLVAGEFGNTCPVYFSVDDWLAVPNGGVPLWGVRSHISGDPRAKLNVPTAEVEDYCRSAFPDGGFNITPMVDHMMVWRGEVWYGPVADVYDGPRGLVLFGVHGMHHLEWRPALRQHGREFTGAMATRMLRELLNGNSFDDLQILLEQYPAHVIEFTVLDRCFGTVKGRNTVVWEVREGMAGEYEMSTWNKYLKRRK